MGKRNPVAFALRTPTYRPRKTKVVKGKGSYTRTKRHRSGQTDGVFFVCRRGFFAQLATRRTPFPATGRIQAYLCFNCVRKEVY